MTLEELKFSAEIQQKYGKPVPLNAALVLKLLEMIAVLKQAACDCKNESHAAWCNTLDNQELQRADEIERSL